MISPAFLTTIVSPILISFLSIKSWLCKEALLTVVPASNIGSNNAVGVKAPVLPTFISIFLNVVSFCSGGYLKAIAQRGFFAVEPNSLRLSKEFTFITAPSISNGYVDFILPISFILFIQSSIL